MARRNLVQELMSELVSYGGTVATRLEVYTHLRQCGASERMADWGCHKYPAVTSEQAATMPKHSEITERERRSDVHSN